MHVAAAATSPDHEQSHTLSDRLFGRCMNGIRQAQAVGPATFAEAVHRATVYSSSEFRDLAHPPQPVLSPSRLRLGRCDCLPHLAHLHPLPFTRLFHVPDPAATQP